MITHYTRTVGQTVVDLRSVKPEQIRLRDITTALGNLPRFQGHTQRHYSIAQHCIHGANLLMSQGDLAAAKRFLLQDCAKAYLGDLTYGAKLLMPTYSDLEDSIREVVYLKYLVSSDDAVVQACKLTSAIMKLNEFMVFFPDQVKDFAEPEFAKKYEDGKLRAHMNGPWKNFQARRIFENLCRKLEIADAPRS